MKRLTLTAFISLWIIFVAAQSMQIQIDSSGSDSSHVENFTAFISNIDKAQITTGILRDMVFPFSPIGKYTGDTLNDTITGLINWNQMYYETYLSGVTAPLVPSLDSVRIQRKVYFENGTIPIGVLNCKYNEIKDSAFADNLFTISNNKLQDVMGRTQSPYLGKRVFAASPMYDEVYRSTVSFYMGQDFYFSNDPDSLLRFEVDFDDGAGFTTVNVGQRISIPYSTLGSKTIIVKAIFQSGKVLQSSSKFTVAAADAPTPDHDWAFDSAPYTFEGNTASGTAYILYGNECASINVLRKPIIVVEGFDPGNERGYDELYHRMNKNCLVEKLRAQGYDFVILNLDAGGDYIQRNAMLVVKLINKVNALKVSDQELIVIGASMGGLLVRYALAYMETYQSTTGPHETKLMITLDSPHEGANITLGSQWWLWFFATYANAAAAQIQVDNGDTYAAQSMILYHRNAMVGTNPLGGGVNQFRIDMLADFAAIGDYPNNLRKVAISNGSITGNTQGFGPCTKLINWVYKPVLVKLVIGNVWALPYPGQTCTIFEGKVPVTPLPFMTFEKWTVTVTNSTALPVDGAPGGQLDLNQRIADSDTQGKGNITTNHPNICFIPIISSLAIQTTNVFYNVGSINNYPYPNNASITPFDVIYAPQANEEHVLITVDNILTLNDEITPDDLYLQNRAITGDADFEARNTVTIGNDVDPVTNRQTAGDFTIESGATNETSAGQEIIVKDGTWIKQGSDAHLFIQPFACSVPQCRLAGTSGDTDDTVTKIPATAEQMIFNEILNTDTEIEDAFSFKTYPNPFADHAHLEYELQKSGYLNISVYNNCGEKKVELVNDNNHQAGNYTVTLDGRSWAPGLYLITVTTEDGTISKQIVKL